MRADDFARSFVDHVYLPAWVVLSDRYDPDHFGDQIVELARPVAIRLVRDRGEWSIEAIGPEGEWRDLATLIAEMPTDGATPVTRQTELLRTHLAKIAGRSAGSAGSR